MEIRVYDNFNKTMTYPSHDTPFYTNVCIGLNGVVYTVGDSSGDGGYCYEEEGRYVPMLRSESTDKDGTYIYDGDIIEYSDEDIIAYAMNKNAGNIRKIERFSDFYELGKNGYIRHLTFFANKSKVIGNIYENPELIE